MDTDFQNIAAVFFDVGNTLVHPDFGVVQEILVAHDIDVSLEAIAAAQWHANVAVQQPSANKPWKSFFGGWFRALGATEADMPDLLARVWNRHRENNLWNTLSGDAIHTLGLLKEQKLKLGVISNSDGTVARLLANIGLSDFFDAIVDSELVGYRKPDPAIFEFALQELQVQPENAVHVGDLYEADVLGAQAAGMQAVLFDPNNFYRHVDCTKIDSLSQLLELISK